MALKIRSLYSDRNNRWEVKVIGEIDIDSASELEERFMDMLEEKNRDIVINAEELEYIDSTGLGKLIRIVKRLKAEGHDLVIVNAIPSITKLFNITGLNKVFILREE